MSAAPRTLFDKLWDEHVITEREDGEQLPLRVLVADVVRECAAHRERQRETVSRQHVEVDEDLEGREPRLARERRVGDELAGVEHPGITAQPIHEQ